MQHTTTEKKLYMSWERQDASTEAKQKGFSLLDQFQTSSSDLY